METGKINIDFAVLNSYDPALLLVGDFSDWKHIYQKPSIIEITLPGSSQAISYSFVKRTINSFNSSTLYLNCSDCDGYSPLPDGVYTIVVKGSPDKFYRKRYYLKIDTLRLELDKIYVGAGVAYNENDKEYREALANIEFKLDVAQAHTRSGNIRKANAFFKDAQCLVEKYKQCKNCY